MASRKPHLCCGTVYGQKDIIGSSASRKGQLNAMRSGKLLQAGGCGTINN